MMKRLLKVSSLALALSALACGASVSSKEDAGKAAAKLSDAGTAANSGAQSSGLLSGAGADATVTVTGKSGTAKVTLHADTSTNGADVVEDIVYANFSADGKNTFDGSVTQTVSTHGDASGAETDVKVKGKVTMSGDYNSVLDVDYRESVKAGISGASVVLDGKVIADGTAYVWANESIVVGNGG